MILSDFHVHTLFCDGTASSEEYVRAAIEKKMKAIGFSAHSHTAFDESWCMTEPLKYRAVLSELKEKYKDKIDILCGVEQDFYSDETAAEYDYVISSVHYIRRGEKYFPIDESAELFEALALGEFGGDFYALAEEYFKSVAEAAQKWDADIVGHFDLIAKFNEGGRFFDEENPRYLSAAHRAAQALAADNRIFEINTGAIPRGYRLTPYPSLPVLNEIARLGGRVILSSDSHTPNTLLFGFAEAEAVARRLGLEICEAPVFRSK